MLNTGSIFLIGLGVFLGIGLAILIRNKTIRLLLNIIFGIIFALSLIIAAQKIMYKDNRVLNCYLYQMSSGSMANTLKTNDYILVMKSNNYKKGDIVTFIKEDRIVTHRIVAINGSNITTKGDANFNIDKPAITKDKIIGKTVFHGALLNAIVTSLKFMIIAFVTTYLVAQLFIKDNQTN